MTTRICFVGLENLPVLAPEFAQHGIGGAQVQQSLVARAFARRGFPVSMVCGDYGQQDGATWSGVRVYKAYSADEGIPVVRFVYPRWTKLCAALRRAAADVYYVSCASAQVGQVAMWAARNGRRMIYRIAATPTASPTGCRSPCGAIESCTSTDCDALRRSSPKVDATGSHAEELRSGEPRCLLTRGCT